MRKLKDNKKNFIVLTNREELSFFNVLAFPNAKELKKNNLQLKTKKKKIHTKRGLKPAVSLHVCGLWTVDVSIN